MTGPLRAGPDTDEPTIVPARGQTEPSGPAQRFVAPVLPEGVRLTRRQVEALRLYANGHTQKEVAHEMGVGLQTIKNLLTEAYLELEAEGAIDALMKLGWLVVPE